MGLALIAALAPFYTFPRPLLDKAFSMAEIVTLFTFAAWLLHRIPHLRTCKPANLQTCKPANLQTCTPANLHTCKLANLHTCRRIP